MTQSIHLGKPLPYGPKPAARFIARLAVTPDMPGIRNAVNHLVAGYMSGLDSTPVVYEDALELVSDRNPWMTLPQVEVSLACEHESVRAHRDGFVCNNCVGRATGASL